MNLIDFLPDPQQQEIADSVAVVLAERLPPSRHRPERAGGAVPQPVWDEIAQLGWFGLGLPESAGGVGFTVFEEALVAREWGRYLAPMALLASMLGAQVAAAAADRELLEGITAGRIRLGLALPADPSAAVEPGTVHGNWLLVDAENAHYVLGWRGRHSFLLAHPGNAVKPNHALDWASSTAAARLQNVRARLHVAGTAVPRVATLLCAAMLAGNAEATRDMAVEYAKQREQFGQAIGAFQAIKHLCADMAVRCEAATSQLMFAARAEAAELSEAAAAISAAKLLASSAAIGNAASNIQVHGGMGFTAECEAHLHLKRAHLLDQLGGEQRLHKDLLMHRRPDLELAR